MKAPLTHTVFHVQGATMRRLFVFLFAAALSASAWAADYYVSTVGNDSNPGTIASPLKTIKAGIAKATSPGDRVLVQAGTYSESVTTIAGGTSGNPITFLAEGAVTMKAFFVKHNYIVVDGFKFTGFNIYGLSMITLRSGADHALIQNNTIRDNAFEGVGGIEIAAGVQSCVVRGNTIQNILGSGIVARGSGHLIQNNTLGGLNGYDAFQIFGVNHLITGNVVRHSPDNRAIRTPAASVVRTWGIDEDNSHDIAFTFNVIDDFDGQAGNLTQDNNGANNIGNWMIANNIFSNIRDPFELAIPTSSLLNNTFFKVGTSGSSGLIVDQKLVNGQKSSSADLALVQSNVFVGCQARTFFSNGGFYTVNPLVTVTGISRNFAAGYPEDAYPARTDFHEANGINGGDPLFANVNDPLAGFLPSDDSALCQTNGNSYIGAIPCTCANPTPIPSLKTEFSFIPGSMTVTFDAGQTHSCGHALSSYHWDFGDGQSASGVRLSHQFSTVGTYVVTLTVRNDINQTATLQNKVTVPAVPLPNIAPTVSAGADKTILLPGENTLLLNDATASDDNLPAQPGFLTYTWSKSSGPASAVIFESTHSLHTRAVFTASGTYTLKLSVSDGQFTTESTTTVNAIYLVNNMPLVFAGADRSVQFPASASINDSTASDDGLPLTPGTFTVEWSTVSNPGTVVFSATHSIHTNVSFGAVGIYVLKLTANDGEFSSFSTMTVTVQAAPVVNKAPVVFAGDPKSITLPEEAAVTSDAFVTDDGLPSTSSLTYAWSKVSGPGVVTFTSTRTILTEVRFSTSGTYVLRLTANDSLLTGIGDVQVVANASFPVTAPKIIPGVLHTVLFPPGTARMLSQVQVATGAYLVNWEQISGPSFVTFASTDVLSPLVTFFSTGTYVLRLNAKQGLASGFGDSTVNVKFARNLTIINGTFVSEGLSGVSGPVAEGNPINISADPPPAGAVFSGWTGFDVDNPNAPVTSFVMPPRDIVITANYKTTGPITTLPNGFSLFSNLLRPNGRMLIIYHLKDPAHVKMTLHTITGEEVRTLVDDDRDSGSSQIAWDGKNANGSDVAAGIYVLILKIGDGTYINKVAVAR